ncbi:MAG: hypothetical protein Q8N01_03400 [Sulfuricurvum sp.]|nr:hypothetical protein [Sulfuricurvum sp.]
MKPWRSAMSLFELIIVVIIVGVVYSLAIFTLKKENAIPSTMSLSSIKTTLLSFSQQSPITMTCDVSCEKCRIFDHNSNILTTLTLVSDAPIHRYGFNRLGELQRWGSAVIPRAGTLTEECFELTLSPDGVITPLILKSDNTFYVYTPLGDNKPYISSSEEEVRNYLFDESSYPLNGDDFYGTL